MTETNTQATNNETAPVYKPGEHPDLPPPMLISGPVAWVRDNLLSSTTNILLTIVSVYFLYKILPPALEWFFFDAAYTGSDRRECEAKAGGACWAFVGERFRLFTYGFYPQAERWRVNIAFILLPLALVPILWDRAPWRRKTIWFSIAFPFIAGWLLLGGFGLTPVSTDKFGGFLLTMIIGLTGIVCSLPIGILLALGRISKLPVIRLFSVCFIEFIRGVPLITLLFVASTMLSYFLPPDADFDLLLRVLIMVTLFASAYMAEVVRGGLQAIPKGQIEAADSMGLKYWQSMRLVVLPQALKISIPGIVNSFIALYKDTTLVIIIGLLDPLGIGRASVATTEWGGLSTEVYVFISIFFFISCFAMARYSLHLERKLETSHQH